VRTLILRDYDGPFERVDVFAMPTSPVAAFKIGERIADPLQMYLIDVFTSARTSPASRRSACRAAFTADHLPSLQLTAPVRRSHAAARRRRLLARHGMVETAAPILSR